MGGGEFAGEAIADPDDPLGIGDELLDAELPTAPPPAPPPLCASVKLRVPENEEEDCLAIPIPPLGAGASISRPPKPRD